MTITTQGSEKMSETMIGTGAPVFTPFPSIARLSRDVVITEKIDGTNAQIHVAEDGRVIAGSRNRWITPEQDNFGFARWVKEHEDELRALGPGSHFGEWWGCGIQRGYGLTEKRFSLFNTTRWSGNPELPGCLHVVPVLGTHVLDTAIIDETLRLLQEQGSQAAPGFIKPEGIVVFHTKSNALFKKTLDKHDGHKSAA
jgi:hypothetical protein